MTSLVRQNQIFLLIDILRSAVRCSAFALLMIPNFVSVNDGCKMYKTIQMH